MNNSGKGKRLEIANQIINLIANRGRRFFYNSRDGEISHFLVKKKRIYFKDKYTKDEVLSYSYKQLAKGMSSGGTLMALVLDMSEWIRTGKYTNGKNGYGGLFCDHWGYSEEDMKDIRQFACNMGYLQGESYETEA